MASPYAADTDVLIDYLREFPVAVEWWESLSEQPYISAITVAELYAGVREGEERTTLDAFVAMSPVVEITARIAEVAGLQVRRYRKSHNVLIPDAIVAASAQVLGVQLVTLNSKHFPMLPNLLVPYTKG